MNLDKIEIIVSEVDGVVTDNLVPLDYLNNVVFKTYNTQDFEVINELKKHFAFVFLSQDPHISHGVMQKRNIPFFSPKTRETKLKVLTDKILPRYNTRPENLLYIGSKFSDIPCMHLAEVSACPCDSPSALYKVADASLREHAGGGVISGIYDYLYEVIEKRIRQS